MSDHSGDAEKHGECDSSRAHRVDRLIVIGLLGLLGLIILILALILRYGEKPKERNRCTERIGRGTIASMKKRYPPDKYDITCDPQTGIVYAGLKPLYRGADAGITDDGGDAGLQR